MPIVGQCLPEGCLFDHAESPVLLKRHRSTEFFAYQRLPLQLLKLSVLKLDGSFFEVQVPKTATVAELQEAVEDVFGQNVSWSHVWGHFCLCYKGQKLINDKQYIRLFGIRDGDQLKFVQHLSVKCEREKRRATRNRTFSSYHEQFVPWDG